MKVLILSCNTGEGHNSSAKALKKCMDARGIQCDVEDTLGLVGEVVSKSMSDLYIFSTKSFLFETAYKVGGFLSDISPNSVKSPVYLTNKLYAKKLYDFVLEGGYDAVVCTHLYPAEALTSLKRKAELDVPVVFVNTDYTCIPFLPETEVDKYVIPHEDLIEEYVEKGIPREKIFPAGIPVDEERFASRIPKDEARRFCSDEFGWDNTKEDSRWFLVMSGSMGFGNLGGLIEELLARTTPDDRIICVCGRNEELRHMLAERFKEDGNIKPVGFTDKVSTLMDASDVLFTKPGGITSTEAAVKNIPLVHTAPIPGVEDYNARFFHYHNMSYSTVDPEQQAAVALRLCNDPQWRDRMLDGQRRNANPHTCEQITDLVCSMI